jgi:excinuclease ABC subunit C
MHLKKLKKIKEKIEVLENYQSRSTIVNQKTNIDVFSIVSESAAYVNFLQIAHGSIIRSHTMEIKKKLEETDEELLELLLNSENASIVVKRNHRSFSCRFGEHIK